MRGGASVAGSDVQRVSQPRRSGTNISLRPCRVARSIVWRRATFVTSRPISPTRGKIPPGAESMCFGGRRIEPHARDRVPDGAWRGAQAEQLGMNETSGSEMLLWVCLAYNCASSSNLYKNALQTRRLKFPTIIKRFQSSSSTLNISSLTL